ncbi:hypothetical protein PIB30_000323 [Stylosanthes scabra]|uniref:Uncharacterized protein n=1 Tax=Stylosanthes scabra TaxID=79078 RepID=A0ABU6T487_9FABA|nr:hypothetical protein [Stylosanthes scabra]
MAPRLTMDSGAIQNGRPQPHITNPGSRRIPSAIDRRLETVVTTPIIILATFRRDDSIVVRMTCTLLQRRMIEIWLVKWYVDSVASLCLTNGLTKDDFNKQLMTKPMRSRKGIQDNQHDSGFKGQPKPLKQKFKNTAPLAASITEIYPKISEKRRPSSNQTPKRKNPKYKKQIFVL